MALGNLSVKNLNKVPWFIAGRGAGIITSKTVPESVTDSKVIQWNETPVPGSHTGVPKYGGMQARRISFSLKVAEFNDTFGVTTKLAQFRRLRNPEPEYVVFGGYQPFSANKTVFYFYGTVSPFVVECYVNKVDFTLTYPNKYGRPQVGDVQMELIVREEGALWAFEREWSQLKALLGLAKSVAEPFSSGNPYKGRGLL